MSVNDKFQGESTTISANEPKPSSNRNNRFSLSRRIVFRREKILEKDREKRRNIFFSFAFLLVVALVSVLFLAFKPSVLQDNHLINNIELLSNNEDLNFYNEVEFYQWLDSSAAEKSIDSI